MSSLPRVGVVVAVLAGSFGAGYYLKPAPVVPAAVAQAPIVPPPGLPPVVAPVDTHVKPATAVAPEVDPNDPALKMLRDAWGVKTTSVLAEAMKEPIPMGGPMPRLEPPPAPAPALPMIDPSPVRRPDPSAGPSVRITIRDAGGHVTTLTTTGRVTIDLIGPDTPPLPEPGPKPHVAGEPVSAARPAAPISSDPVEVCYELLGGLRLNVDGHPVSALTGGWVALRDVTLEGMDSLGPPGKLVIWNERLRVCSETFAGFSQGRTVLSLITDRSWKPTTATPDSCRWEYEPGPTNFWGTPPVGLRLDF